MSSSATQPWQRALSALREEIPERTIENWLVDAVPESIDEDAGPHATVILRVSSAFCREYILSNFRSEIEEALTDVLERPVELTLTVGSSPDSGPSEAAPGGAPEGALGDGASDEGNGAVASPSEAPSSETEAREGPAPGPEGKDPRPEAETGAPNQASERDPSPPSEPSSSSRTPAPFSPEGVPAREPAGQTSRTDSVSDGTAGRESAPAPTQDERSPGPEQHGGAPSSNGQNGHTFFSEQKQNLRPEFTFEHFLEGDSNQLARSASVAVAKEPGVTKYNPLVVYGEVGLGKTHLAQAIANHALEHDTAETICYVSSEKFTSQFVAAIREDNFRAFSAHYRSVDLLVVDDVQFFGGKEKTQEEFFHLFNDLHQNGKQIVLCADRPPKKIAGIEDRLLSRFQWGLTADIQRPDLEMRMAVLQLKADQLDLELEPKVLEILAQHITENIRQLEGALKQLSARETLIDGKIDVEVARDVLDREYGVGAETRQPEVEDIIQGVTAYFSLSSDDLVSRNRTQEISDARQVAMYLAREMTSLSYSSIGLRFGGRDHSTVIHACNKVEDQLEVQQGFEEKLKDVRSAVRRHLRSR